LHHLYPCGVSWPTYKDDAQICEALHGSREQMCQGMEDENLHINFNVHFKMTVTLPISVQPVELSKGGSSWEKENKPGKK